MKNFLIILLFSNLISGQSKNQNYLINGTVSNGYSGYIYLGYDNVKDSCLIKDNKFHFRGSVKTIKSAYFSTANPCVMERDFYLENDIINININVGKKKFQDLELDLLSIKFIKANKTNLIQNEFFDFRKKNKNDKDSIAKLITKLSLIIDKYPKNVVSGDFLALLSRDTLINVERLKPLYNKLHLKSQNPQIISTLKRNLFPENSSKIGNKMFDFELRNNHDDIINTKKYRSSLLLIDFWASWCAPCRKQLPELTKIYDKYKDKGFKILSVSLDTDKVKWINAIENESIKWENVIEVNDFEGSVTKWYEVFAIPNTFLIDSKGTILATNMKISNLDSYLFENLK